MLTNDGATLGRYQLIAEIARGGMGDVYLAVVRGPGGFNKLVVLKELRPTLVRDVAFLTMFTDEARLCARMNHPNIVQTYEVGSEGDRHYIAMEYLEGQTLADVRSRATPETLPRAALVQAIADTLSGLHYAHELRDFDGTPLHVVHRDVSPQNVFITYDGQVKVVDFGVAKALDSAYETKSGVLKGKVAYMSPEQARGETVDHRADLFSVGVMLWEILAGERLWERRGEIAILRELAMGTPPSLREKARGVHDALVRVCERALERRPDDRWQTAAEFEAALVEAAAIDGTRVTQRDLGRSIGQLFIEDRARMKAVVDEQLRRLRQTDVGAPIPSVLRLQVADRTGVTMSERARSSTGLVGLRSSVPSTRPARGAWRVARGAALVALLGVGAFVGVRTLWQPPAPAATAITPLTALPSASPEPEPSASSVASTPSSAPVPDGGAMLATRVRTLPTSKPKPIAAPRPTTHGRPALRPIDTANPYGQ